MSVYKAGTKWAYTGCTQRYKTKEEAEKAEKAEEAKKVYDSIKKGRSDGPNIASGGLSESSNTWVSGSSKHKTSTAADSDNQRPEQPEVSIRGGSPSETSW